MTDSLDLDAILASADAATPGPWYQILQPWGDGEWVNARSEDPHGGALVCDCQAQSETSDDNNNGFADAAFIAGTRTWVPQLVARVRELEEQLQKAYRQNEVVREAGARALADANEWHDYCDQAYEQRDFARNECVHLRAENEQLRKELARGGGDSRHVVDVDAFRSGRSV